LKSIGGKLIIKEWYYENYHCTFKRT
jgi:hypothetical protein